LDELEVSPNPATLKGALDSLQTMQSFDHNYISLVSRIGVRF
jgi:hypothetical protein